MKIDFVYPDNGSNNTSFHKMDKKCVGRFFNIDWDFISIDTQSLIIHKRSQFGNNEYFTEDFTKLSKPCQEYYIRSLCGKCCKDVIKILNEAIKK